MTLKEMIKLCESKQKSLEDYKAVRDIIGKEYDKLSEEEKYILGDHMEFLELTIDILEGEGFYGKNESKVIGLEKDRFR